MNAALMPLVEGASEYRHRFVIPDGSLWWDVKVLYTGEHGREIEYLSLYWDEAKTMPVSEDVCMDLPPDAERRFSSAIDAAEFKLIDRVKAITGRQMSAREALEWMGGGE